MTNPHKGEVELKAGDQVYTLRYSIDAICSLEGTVGKGFAVIATEMSDVSKMTLTMVRQVLHAGLQERHPDVSLKQAGELIIGAGGAAVVTLKISEAFGRAFPDPEASGTPRPPNRAARRAGTGRVS